MRKAVLAVEFEVAEGRRGADQLTEAMWELIDNTPGSLPNVVHAFLGADADRVLECFVETRRRAMEQVGNAHGGATPLDGVDETSLD